MSYTENTTKNGRFFSTAPFFSLKQLRMKIALRLVPSGTPADEILKAFGVDLEKKMSDMVATAIKANATSAIANLEPNFVAGAIVQNKHLDALQKEQIFAILTAARVKTDYLR